MTMTNNEFVNKVHQTMTNIQDYDDNDLWTDDDDENDTNEPGELTDEGDIISVFKTSEGKQQHIQYGLDAHIYQQILKYGDYRLLDLYNSNAIYLCDKNEIKTKIMAHVNRTDAYVLIDKLTKTNPTCVQQYLDTIVKQVNTLLDDLIKSHCINESQFREMNVKRSKKNIPFQPIMVCSLGPTIGIARYISRLLQPIYDQVASSTTFYKETDAVHAVEIYTEKGLLRPTTLFGTVHLHDLCTIISHEEMIQALERFLNDYYKPDSTIQGITSDTILKLIHLILQNQFFVFQNTIYRQIKGGTTTSPLTILLMNIYMFYWQENLVKTMVNKNELFGRCFDVIFLTWNGSRRELRSLLQATINTNKQLSPKKITTSIGKKINYMDIQIVHSNGGHLQTKLNHDFNIELRCLPYVSGHSRNNYSTLIRASLIRAVLCCSNAIDFYHERRYIEKIFNTHGYTWDYINDPVEEFFEEFNAIDALASNLGFDESLYEDLRFLIFAYDQEEMNMKIQQRKTEQNMEKWYILSILNGDELEEFQENLENLWKNYRDNHIELRNINIEVIHQPNYPSNTK